MDNDWKSRPATVFKCRDGKMRVFIDSMVCLGVVVSENDVETDPDVDPIGAFRGLVFAVTLMVCFAAVLWVGFKVIAWSLVTP